MTKDYMSLSEIKDKCVEAGLLWEVLETSKILQTLGGDVSKFSVENLSSDQKEAFIGAVFDWDIL
tara:strand:+ start:1775 stop:1969 length:195 start_codon:yes stop_codon:yes gene_type:complete